MQQLHRDPIDGLLDPPDLRHARAKALREAARALRLAIDRVYYVMAKCETVEALYASAGHVDRMVAELESSPSPEAQEMRDG